jgi:hypothetical protein
LGSNLNLNLSLLNIILGELEHSLLGCGNLETGDESRLILNPSGSMSWLEMLLNSARANLLLLILSSLGVAMRH